MSDREYDKPLPEPSPDTAPYWDGLRQGKLMLQSCDDCKRFRHYPRPVCPYCHSMNVAWRPSSGRGNVHSWTIAHHAFHPGFKRDLPYALATVDLEEGVRINVQFRGDPALLRIGLPVKVAFEIAAPELTLPVVVAA